MNRESAVRQTDVVEVFETGIKVIVVLTLLERGDMAGTSAHRDSADRATRERGAR